MDALQNELIIGNMYGYAGSTNGFATISIGKCVAVKENKATLQIIKQTRYLYQHNPEEQELSKRKINIFSGLLFPVVLNN